MELSVITRYFPELTPTQLEQFALLEPLYREWNEKINVISRKDIDALAEHHIFHSLAIARFHRFSAGSTILDVGTGGGFPGIPLAIFFPECQFTLVDSIGKKIKVVQAVVDALGLQNVQAVNARCEQLSGSFDFVVSRAVTELATFIPWVWTKINKSGGIIYLKGGDLREELAAAVQVLPTGHPVPKEYALSEWFDNEFFTTKKLIYIVR